MEAEEELPYPWTLFTDGSSYVDGSGAGLILTNLEGAEFTYALRFNFNATNNKAEYEALIASLRIAKKTGIKNLQANVDSRLVANQVNTSYIVKELGMIQDELKEKSINELEVLAVVEEEGDTWMTPIYNYLAKEKLHADKKKARAIRRYMHAEKRYVVAKAIRIGYYWPTMHADARKMIRECQDCQGIDIARPFLDGPDKVKFLIVAIDYFTKWIEANPVAMITGNQIEEIPHVLWAHRMTIKSSNGDTLFSLTYGTKAVIPAEIGMPTLRTAEIDIVQNDKALEINLDLLEVKREQAAIHEARSKAKMEKYYNFKVRSTSFKPGDLVYRNNDVSHAKDSGKPGPEWEGPYEVTEALGNRAYKLRDHNRKHLPRTWNARNLKKCYVHEM
ncbi:reverse transcriptase domain-containing protein [Tanacetum coccineum]